MARDHQAGEPTGQVDQWNNAQAYLNLLQRADWTISESLYEGDVPSVLRGLEIMYIQLKRNRSKNKRSKEFFDEVENEDNVRKRINDLHKRYNQLGRVGSSRPEQEYKDIQLNKVINEAIDIYDALGDYMYQEGLIFEKGTDPNRAWAEG